ncbi:MAG: hypothetical protein IJS13_07150 [Paludibacteraceae bacterium]|nr:hypothetical protein [Paludibacteraceae bacterium]
MQAIIISVGGICYAPCPHGIGECKVGSYSCKECEFFGGRHGQIVECLHDTKPIV